MVKVTMDKDPFLLSESEMLLRTVMQDRHGVFYYPIPENKQLKMYVRVQDGIVEFRPHHSEHQELWAEHGWISYETARKAGQVSKEKGGRYPLHLYDFEVALGVLQDQARE